MKTIKRISLTLTTAILGLLSYQLCHAEQLVNADEKTPQKAQISRSSLSRVSIDGGRITNVKWIDNELEIEKDGDSGQVYVRALTAKSSSLFVTSDEGKTYLLILSPTAKQSDSNVINLRGKQQSDQAAIDTRPRIQPVTTTSGTYVRSIKQLMIGLIRGNPGGMGMSASHVYETVPLWSEVLFVKTKQYTASDMQAEAYTLTNTTSNTLTLREQEFYKRGVLAVTIMKQSLQPGEATDVYIVKSLGGV